jgi:di/tripeptidase
LVNRLTALSVPSQPRSSLNVGVFSGGISVNTIAAEAHLELDLRSEGIDALSNLAGLVEGLVQDANRTGVRAACQVIGNRPAGSIASNHWLVQLAQHGLLDLNIQPRISIGSTDANIPLSRGLPAVCIGLSHGGGAHTTQEYINLPSIETGLSQLITLVQNAFIQRAKG